MVGRARRLGRPLHSAREGQSLPALVTRKDWVFKVTFALVCLQDAPRGNSELLVSFYLCACSFTFMGSVFFLQGKDWSLKSVFQE